jgi:hypothetical protein
MSLLAIDRHEFKSTNDRMFRGVLGVFMSCRLAELPCQTEVDEKYRRGNTISSSSDHEITWFDVAMNVVVIM